MTFKVLEPLNYELDATRSVFSSPFADPLGRTEGVNYGINFVVSPVPDAGSTLMLLGLALSSLGLLGWRRVRA